MKKNTRSKEAVSEVVSIVLLLGITITLFGFLNFIVFSFSFGASAPSVSLIATMDWADNAVLITHQGGDSLPGATEVIITVDSSVYQKNAGEILLDTNLDGEWSFGEIVHLPVAESIIDAYVHVIVLDLASNTVILTTVLQKGA